MRLDEFIKDNYKHLLQVAKRIAKKEAEDLLSSTYLSIFDKKDFELPSNNEEAIKYFVACLNNNYKFYKSSFNAEKRGKDLLVDSTFFEVVEIANENEITPSEVERFKETLPEHEQILFELHYECGVSIKSIAEEFKQISMDENVVRKLKKPIQNKIKDKWKQ